MPMIKQNDVIDVIYDSIYGYSLEEAFEILEGHRKGAYIPIEWIEKFMNKFRCDMVTSDEYAFLHFMLCEWEKENESRKGEEVK